MATKRKGRKRAKPMAYSKRNPYPYPGKWNTPEGIELLLQSVRKDVSTDDED